MDEKKQVININISTNTILKILFILFVLYMFFLLGDIIIILFVSLILASLISPLVDFLQRKKIPRGVGVILIYLVLFALFSFVIYSIVPPVIKQINEFSKDSPDYLENIFSKFSVLKESAAEKGILDNLKNSFGTLTSNLTPAAGGVFATIGGFFGGIFSIVLILVITFYMVTEDNGMKKFIWSVVPEKHQPYIIQLLSRMQKKVSLWLKGQAILSLIIFIVIYVGLLFLGVKHALVLGLFAGMAEFVPYLGPVLAAIPALIIAFVQSPILALFVLIFYYLVQMTENHILVPKVMQKVVGLNPIIIIIILIVGFKLSGILGAVLAIPVATAISVFFKDIMYKRSKDEEAQEII